MILSRGGISMGNPKRHSKPYTPNHIGTQPRAAGGNKGKQMQDKSGKHAQVIQTKGE
jgi:small acid-soluble spore protein N (minor)